MTTIHEAVTTQRRNWDGKLSRTFETVYTLPTGDPNVWRELTIATSYHDRHYYYGNVTRCKVTREVHDYGTFLSSSHALFEGGPVPTTVIERNVSRYSAKHLSELHQGWLASVQEYDMGELLEWAERAS